MDRYDQELLDKQLRGLSAPRNDGVIAVLLAVMFLGPLGRDFPLWPEGELAACRLLRRAALYEPSRLRSKYFFPASGTDIVRGTSPVDFVIFPAPVSAKNDLQNTTYVLDRFDAI
jgi:hypothetical protein